MLGGYQSCCFVVDGRKKHPCSHLRVHSAELTQGGPSSAFKLPAGGDQELSSLKDKNTKQVTPMEKEIKRKAFD